MCVGEVCVQVGFDFEHTDTDNHRPTMKAAAVVRTALQGQQRHTNTARRINNSSYGRYSSNLLSNFHPTVLSKCDDEEKRRHDDTVAATAFHSRGFCQSLLPQLLSTRLLSHHYHDSHSNFSSLSTRRQFHTTPTPERYAAIVMTLGAIAATAKAGQYAVQGYNEWKEAAAAQQQQQEMEERGKMEQQGKEGKEDTTFTAEGGNTSGASFSDSRTGDDAQSKGEEKTTEGRRENIFASFFDMAIGSKYYEGEKK